MKRSLLRRPGIVMTFLLLMMYCTSAYAYDVVVAKDGSGNFTSVQAAIDAAPTGRTTPYTIFIKNGKYKEKINIASNKPFLQIIGESVANVILTYDDYSGKPMPGGGVYGTSNSASFTVRAADFTAINITFENTTGESPQALAIYVDGDRAAFKNCRFLGGQDTVYAGGNGARQYFKSCYIDGTVDFIFGDARAVFDSTVIYAKTRASAGASYITAANTKQTEPYGYVFRDCKIPANRGGTAYFLGRPWQNDAATADAAKSWNKTVFINTTMSSSVQTPGWSTWDAGTDVTKITYAEYRSKKFDSSLVDVSGRVSWSKQLTAAEAMTYNNTTLFAGWDPCTVTADFCTYVREPIAVSNFRGVKGASTSTFTWNISWPIAQVQYEVLRSNDRINFTPVNSQTSLNDSTVNFNYAEAVPPPGATYYYLVRASKAGYATHISDTVTISSTPTINVTGSMGSFIQGVGTPSTSQSYIVSASSLTNNLIITAPANYELSVNGGTTWITSSNPVVLTPDANGNVPNTTVSVRLNATAAGTYAGNIVHTSIGATDVSVAVSGTVQSTPLSVSEILEWWPMTVSNADSAAIRSAGLVATTPTLNKLYLSNGTTVPSVPAYSPLHGQAFGATANGDGSWGTAAGGPGGNLNRTFYEQYTITASATHSVRLDSLVLNSSFYNTSSNTKLAVVYSLSGFTTGDSTDVTGGVGPAGTQLPANANGGFLTPVLINNETAGNTSNYRFALAGGTGITLASGQTLTIRLYFSCGSSSTGRYAKVKDVYVKGLATANPVISDYRSRQSGDWTDLNTWERWDGTTWVTPVPAYPVYNNSNVTTVLNGHTVTVSASLANGSGYIHLTKVNNGGQMIVNSAATLKIANDAVLSTTDLQVDGTFTLFGALQTNGNVSMKINGTFVNSGTSGTNMSNPGDTVVMGPQAIFQHNINSPVTPAAMVWQPGSKFLITGLTTSQTGIFKNNIKYSNIVWNNTGQTNYYAIRTTLDSVNVTGSFTVQSTGTTYLSFANSSTRTAFAGGYYQTGGTVNWRESGNITDTLDLGGDFSVTGGSFISNTGTGSSLLVRLNGTNKTITYAQNTATNTNWQVNGVYTLASNMQLPSGGSGVSVNGTLNLGTNAVSGAGDFTLNTGGVLSSGAPLGLNGNLTNSGAKTLSNAATYIYNGTAAQVTGALLPATIGSLTISNPADVTLSGPVSVTGALSLSNGKLVLGSNSVTAASVLGSNASRYVVTNGTGYLKINNVGAGNNLFPVGPSATAYNPVIINNSGTADNFAVSVKNTFDNALPDATKAVTAQWTINEDVAGGSNVALSLSWITADQGASFNPAAASSIIRFNGTNWTSYPATITGAGTVASPYTATASGITAFSPFAVTNDAALPLNLVSFNAAYANREVLVSWSTTNELNTKEFAVERSRDGVSFGSIGNVRAYNNSGAHQYSLKDASPIAGINYYRLKTIDIDGSFHYSKVVAVSIGSKQPFTILSNPVKDQLNISHTAAGAQSSFTIISSDGKVMYSSAVALAATRSTLQISTLGAGVYTLVYTNNGETATAHFLKQ